MTFNMDSPTNNNTYSHTDANPDINKSNLYYSKYDKLNQWLDSNIYSNANGLYSKLIESELITWESIENLFPEVIPEDYSNYEDYEDAFAFTPAKQIYEWYLVSDIAYEKFKSWDYPVIKFEEIYLWGRTCCGQPISVDFYYSPEKINDLVN